MKFKVTFEVDEADFGPILAKLSGHKLVHFAFDTIRSDTRATPEGQAQVKRGELKNVVLAALQSGPVSQEKLSRQLVSRGYQIKSIYNAIYNLRTSKRLIKNHDVLKLAPPPRDPGVATDKLTDKQEI